MNGKKLFLPLVWLCVLGVLTLPMTACSGPERETEQEQEVGNTEVETKTDAAGNVEEVETESDRVDADIDVEDAGITAKVKTKYAADESVSALNINVDTKDGVVTLHGNVADQAAKDKAAELARATEGVSQVVNNLTVGDASETEDKDTKGNESDN